MMTYFIITLSLFWPLPREGLSRSSVRLKSLAYLLLPYPHSSALFRIGDFRRPLLRNASQSRTAIQTNPDSVS
jgi:hypothetical protein